MGGALRTRMRYLERAKEAADRRVTRLYRELDVSIPCKAYEMLVEKYAALQRTARKRTEEAAEAVTAADELLDLRDEVSHLTKHVFELLDELAHEKEGHRQADRLAREGGGGGGGARPVTVGTGSARAEARPMQASVVSSQSGGSHPEDVAELVRLRVGESNARKRSELEQRKSQRAIESEGELRVRITTSMSLSIPRPTVREFCRFAFLGVRILALFDSFRPCSLQARLGDVEQQLADSAQELHAAQESNKLYRERLQGSLPQAEAAALKEQMEVSPHGRFCPLSFASTQTSTQLFMASAARGGGCSGSLGPSHRAHALHVSCSPTLQVLQAATSEAEQALSECRQHSRQVRQALRCILWLRVLTKDRRGDYLPPSGCVLGRLRVPVFRPAAGGDGREGEAQPHAAAGNNHSAPHSPSGDRLRGRRARRAGQAA